jgi:hypothetical protein
VPAQDWINLTNGTLCGIDVEPGRYLRLQSTWCEAKRWDDILWTLPVGLYMSLAAGDEVVVHDQSERARATRAQWQGLSWVRYYLGHTWGLRQAEEISRSGMDVGPAWASTAHGLQGSRVEQYVRFFRKYVSTDGIRLSACDCLRVLARP